MAKVNYTISITTGRRKTYPNASRYMEEKGGNLSETILAAVEILIQENGWADKAYKYIDWATEGKLLELEGGKFNG